MKTYYLSNKPFSVNHSYATNFRTRQRFKTKDYNAWLADSISQIEDQGVVKFEGDYYVSILIPLKYRTKRNDVSNFVKPIIDMLVKAGATPDDKYEYGHDIRWAKIDRVFLDVKPMPTEPI